MRHSPRRVVAAIVGLAPLFASAALARGDGPDARYLSDPKAGVIYSSSQAWGELGIDSAVRPIGRAGAPLRIGDRAYPRGLGHHASGEITVDLEGRFLAFDAEAGIQWQGGNTTASVVFQVYVDGRKVFDSGVVRETDPPRTISVPTRKAQELRLVVTDAGDGITSDCADWALARLTIDPDAEAADRARPEVNIVPFGRLMAWDPARREGTSALRIGEFPAEDIEMGRPLAAGRDGSIEVPDWEGRNCLGVQWPESRSLRRLELEFSDGPNRPADDSVVAETWIGESAWQGRWAPLEAQVGRDGSRLVWEIAGPTWRTPTPKVRWVFPSGGRPVVVKAVVVFTRSRWRAEDLRIEKVADSASPDFSIEVYNGVLQDPPSGDPLRLDWKTAKTRDIRLLASTSRTDKTDRTVLRFGPDPNGFAIAVEDVLAHGSVTFRGVRVSTTGGKAEVDSRAPAVSPGVLDEVRSRPDETLGHAMDIVHRDVQDLGPMMLSLAADNRKIVVDREGDVRFDASTSINDKAREIPDQWRLQVRPGTGKPTEVSRRLRGGWLPIPETTTWDGPIVYRQATCVAPLGEAGPDRPTWVRDRAVGVVELTIRNEGDAPAPARLVLSVVGASPVSVNVESPGTTIFQTGDRVLAIADVPVSEPISARSDPAGIALDGTLAPKTEARCVVLVPLWPIETGEKVAPPDGSTWEEQTASYWRSILTTAMQVDLPDPFLNDLVRASRVHCLLAARSEDSGRRVAAWISSDRYGPLESEAHAVVRGMDLLGHSEYARRSLEYFIKRYSPEGFLTTGYTLIGTGEHLWTLAEHFDRTRDEAWLRQAAPELKRVCAWIVRQRAKTKQLDRDGRKLPGYGLMPPGVSADWNRYAYRFFNDAQYCAGLAETARILTVIHDPAASALSAEAEAYRADLLAAYRWTQSRSPVLPLGDGRWSLAQPALLDSFGHVEEFQPGEDGNRSWAYSVEIGAHHLAATGILDPVSQEVGEMLDYLEGSPFLRSGMGEYPEPASRKDPFGLGGFAKVQPFYARVADLYAVRDDVKPFLRAYFHATSSLVSRENMSLWEHFHNQGGWNKTHETGWFLAQTRLMLVQERGEDLWLAPLITDRWLTDGKTTSVRNAPTRFGEVGYTLKSRVAEGRIEAAITPPDGPTAPRRLVLRLRHPDGKLIRSVTVSGQAHTDFDPTAGIINLPAGTVERMVQVAY